MDLKTAIKILNIKNEISLYGLRTIYRNLVKKYHPDISVESETIMEINEAYDFLKNYLTNYKIKVDDLCKGNSEERTFNRFKNDWLGGNPNE